MSVFMSGYYHVIWLLLIIMMDHTTDPPLTVWSSFDWASTPLTCMMPALSVLLLPCMMMLWVYYCVWGWHVSVLYYLVLDWASLLISTPRTETSSCGPVRQLCPSSLELKLHVAVAVCPSSLVCTMIILIITQTHNSYPLLVYTTICPFW